MTTPLEAMRLAKEALIHCYNTDLNSDGTRAITALTNAIKQMESVEPIAWIDWDYGDNDEQFAFTTARGCGIPVYRHPAVPSYDATKWREAYAAGQRDMQEMAANVCESWNCGFSLTANECAEEIRNLEVK